MAKQLQLRRGTTAEHTTTGGGFTGAVGEVTVDTDKDTVVVHDGSLVGGHPLATATNFRSTGIDDNSNALAITIDSSENVGIGETVPAYRLHLKTSDGGTQPSWDSANRNLALFETGENEGAVTIFAPASATNLYYAFADPSSRLGGYIKYGHSADLMTFGTAAADKMYITSSGNVGINETNPDAMIEVKNVTQNQYCMHLSNHTDNASGYSDGLCISSVNGQGSNALYIESGVASGGAPETGDVRFVVTGSGNVGIGQDTPAANLDIKANSPKLRIGQSTTACLDIWHDYSTADNYFDSNYPSGDIIFRTTASLVDRLHILSGGNVGIGTAVPVAPLELVGATSATLGVPQIRLSGRTYEQYTTIGFGYNGSPAGFQPAEIGFYEFSQTADTRGNLIFATRSDNARTTAPSVRMTIDFDGNVGIGAGAITPTAQFHVGSSGDTYMKIGNNGVGVCAIKFNNTDDWTIGVDSNDSNKFKIAYYSSLGSNNRFVIDTDGNVGIGTAPVGVTGATLRVAGHITNDANVNYNLGDSVRYWSYAYVWNGVVSNPSNRVLKENIEPIGVGLDFLNTLNIVQFDWTEDSGFKGLNSHKQIGLVGDEIKAAVEALPSNDTYGFYTYVPAEEVEDNPSGLDDHKIVFEKFIPSLIRSVQELSAKVAALEAA